MIECFFLGKEWELKVIKQQKITGCNVTIPFKKIANEMVDIKINNNQSFVHDELMAINTIKIIDDKLIGYNTDFFGFFSDLMKRLVALNILTI